MDDIRRPYQGQRGDYALPSQPAPQRPAPRPMPHPTPQHHAAPAPAANNPYDIAAAPITAAPAAPLQRSHEAPPHRPQPKAKRGLPIISLPIIGIVLLAAAAAAGGYLLLKPHKTPTLTPSSLAAKASFTFYYPQPLPNGYSYVDTINTFEGGQAYYMIASGSRHIIIHEQAAAGQSLDLSGIDNPVNTDTSAGKAAIGTTGGQPAAKLLTSTTLISLNGTGKVTQDDIGAVISSLKPVPR